MDNGQLSKILREFTFVISYIKILRDYCEHHENCREIGAISPFVELIYIEFNKALNELDIYELNFIKNS